MHRALIALACAALAYGQPKKVVFTASGTQSSPNEKEMADLRAAAPGITLVPYNEATVMGDIADADGIIGNVTPEMVRAAKKLKWVQVGSAGVERYLFPELKDSNIVLTNCKILQGPEIADHAFALLLSLTRELHRIIPRRTAEEWQPRAYRPLELRGKNAVVVGVGGIGTQIAIRAAAFGMTVTGVDLRELPYTPFLTRTVPPDRLDTVLPSADVLFLAAPETLLTRGMIGARQFALMKPGAYFIAVSRGRLYDAGALAEAIAGKRLAGAGIDVMDPEPLPKGHPLWKFENVVITPHIAGRSDGEHARYLELFAENLKRFAAGEPLLHVVDKQAGY
ncbi:MAG: D-2-hydroxyacid dehydrogenase [Bryobacteraceae bacterium]